MEDASADGGRSCPRCGASFAVGALSPDVRWLCGRCDQPLAGPARTSFDTLRSRPEVRWLYAGARPSEGPREREHALVERRIGRYTLRSELGRGGMGVVYRAWDADLAREVALKVLLSGEHSAHEHVERFLREARAAAKLVHPNLVRVHDIGWAEDRAYFTMDLVDGPSLQDVVATRGRLAPGEALRIGSVLARALHAAHQRGLVHRDVKPGNVLLRADGTPLLADFGLATELGPRGARLTKTGQVMGTPAYMAPEQTGNRALVGPLTDQYSLGAVLYELLTGLPPYRDEGPVEVLYALIAGPPLPRRRGVRRGPRAVAARRGHPGASAVAPVPVARAPGPPPPGAARGRGRARRRARRGPRPRQRHALGRDELEREAEASRAFDEVVARAADLRAGGRADEARGLLASFAGQEARQGTGAAVRALGEAAGLVPDDELDEA